jgi:hypothetical protein
VKEKVRWGGGGGGNYIDVLALGLKSLTNNLHHNYSRTYLHVSWRGSPVPYWVVDWKEIVAIGGGVEPRGRRRTLIYGNCAGRGQEELE